MDKKNKCYICDKQKSILLNISTDDTSPFISYGICTDCLKDSEIDDKILQKNEKYIKEQLDDALERVKYWRDLLSNLNKKI